MDRYLTGLWTQRSPLRDADVPYLYGKFYSASRFDSLIDGLNCELSAKLTLIRRPGSSVYNSATFPAINRYSAFKYLTAGTESIKVLADTASVVYDATGPSTKTALLTKSAGAGKAFFQAVGNTLYMADGVETKKLLEPTKVWTANTQYNPGDWILDSRGNLQLNLGLQTARIVQAAVFTNTAGTQQQLWFQVDPATPINLFQGHGADGILLNSIVFDAASAFAPCTNNAVIVGISATSYPGWYASNFFASSGTGISVAGVTYVNGTIAIGGPTGATAPSWGITQGNLTEDGSALWINYGPNLQNWGGAGPAAAPTVAATAFNFGNRAEIPGPQVYFPWTASTVYGAPLTLIDSNSNIQQLIKGGETGSSVPAWNATVGGTTTDNSAAWANKGAGNWVAGTAYALGALTLQSVNGTNTLFICVQAGTSASAAPNWGAGYGNQVADGTVLWQNAGTPWSAWAASALVASLPSVVDGGGDLEAPTNSGAAGATAPTWAIVTGAYTVDGAITWVNAGYLAAAMTAQKTYAYAWGSSISGAVTTASPASSPIQTPEGQFAAVTVSLPVDPQYDTVIVYATAQGGSTLLQLAVLPVQWGGGNSTIPWKTTQASTLSFYDTLGDAGLNEDIEAAIADANDPPPANISAMTYYLGRVWGIVGNQVVWSTGPDVTTGNGLEAFAPLNSDACQELCTRLQPITASSGSALLVYSNANVYVIQGNGTAANPFTPMTIYMPNIGLLNYDALDVVGSTSYLLTNASKFVSLDPSAGYTEVGFPVGDQFIKVTTGGIDSALYNPATAFVTWYEKSSPDSGIYVADGAVGWLRLSPVSAPESGMLWSPRAAIAGGTSAVQAVETAPGLKSLLIGPPSSGPILLRDLATNADDGTSYANTYATVGNIQLCQPSEIAEVAFASLYSIKTGTAPTCGFLFDEIAVSAQVPVFDMLNATSYEPPELGGAPSNTLYQQRFVLLQNGECPKCQHVQFMIQWAAENYPNELLGHTIFGAKHQERATQ
jgi:hypothetical protein